MDLSTSDLFSHSSCRLLIKKLPHHFPSLWMMFSLPSAECVFVVTTWTWPHGCRSRKVSPFAALFHHFCLADCDPASSPGFIPMKLPFIAPYSLTVAGAEGLHTLSPHPVPILNCRKRAEMLPLIKLTFGETAADGSGWKDCVAVLGFLKNSGQSDQFSQSLERLNKKVSKQVKRRSNRAATLRLFLSKCRASSCQSSLSHNRSWTNYTNSIDRFLASTPSVC